MNHADFSLSDALRFGWDTTKKNLGTCVGLGLTGAILVLGANGLHQAARHVPALGLALGIGAQVMHALVAMAWIRLALALHDGKTRTTSELFAADTTSFLNYLAVSLLYGLMVGVGFCLLVVPGIYLAARYALAGFLIVDGDRGVDSKNPLDAFTRSSSLTRGARGHLFAAGLAFLGINLLGAMAFGVGLLFTIPVTAIAAAYIYRRLLARDELEHAPPAFREPLAV